MHFSFLCAAYSAHLILTNNVTLRYTCCELPVVCSLSERSYFDVQQSSLCSYQDGVCWITWIILKRSTATHH